VAFNVCVVVVVSLVIVGVIGYVLDRSAWRVDACGVWTGHAFPDLTAFQRQHDHPGARKLQRGHRTKRGQQPVSAL